MAGGHTVQRVQVQEGTRVQEPFHLFTLMFYMLVEVSIYKES